MFFITLSLISASSDDFCLQHLLLWCLQNGDFFLFLTFFLHRVVEILLRKSHQLILWEANIIKLHVHVVLDFAIRSFSSCVLYFFNMSPLIFEHLFIFWHCNMSQLILDFAYPRALKSASSPKSLDSFYWRMSFRNHNLGLMCAHN